MAARDYSEAETQACLLALAAHAGQAGPAARALKAQGIDIPESTLRGWKDSKREQYDHLRERYGRQLEEELARSLRESISYAQGVMVKAVAAAEKRLDEGKDINPSQTAGQIARVVGTGVDKLLSLTGRPVNPTSNRTPEEIVRALQSRGLLLAPPKPVDAVSTADEEAAA